MLVQYIVSTQYMLYVYIYIHIVYTDIPEKAQMQAHLRDFCFWIVFSPHERNCTTFGMFALLACLHFLHVEAKIMSVFFHEVSVNTQEKHK